jgi:hypothetical protein
VHRHAPYKLNWLNQAIANFKDWGPPESDSMCFQTLPSTTRRVVVKHQPAPFDLLRIRDLQLSRLTHVLTATPVPNLSEPQVIDLSGGELKEVSAAGAKVEGCRRLSKFGRLD